MTRPRMLSLYCGAGGDSVGYHRAGFDVVGVDNQPQPNFPYEFIQYDALDYLRIAIGYAPTFGYRFDAIHASPPCQAFSALGTLSDNEHEDLLTPTRVLLEQTGLPYVIENVPGAPMRRDYELCGSMFGLAVLCKDDVCRQLRRHRWFETNWPVGLQPQCVHHGQPIGVYGTGGGGAMTRGYKADLVEARCVMGTPWMNRAEVSQAIPPAFTEHIGAQLMRHLSTEPAPAGVSPANSQESPASQ